LRKRKSKREIKKVLRDKEKVERENKMINVTIRVKEKEIEEEIAIHKRKQKVKRCKKNDRKIVRKNVPES
jgi:hypothetical protein